MRITREQLLKLARETAEKRARADRDIIAAYLIGSCLQEDPFLGGTTDVDIVFVTFSTPKVRREVTRLSNDVHLDVQFHAREEYDPPRELRGNPWLGYEIYDPLLLYETQHFFEFVQAILRAGFDEVPAIVQRCRRLIEHGRGIWSDLQSGESLSGPERVQKYFKALYHVACAVGELSGPPLAERRLLADFPRRAEAAGHPEWTATLLELLGAPQAGAETLSGWLGEWQAAYQAAAGTGRADPRIHPARLNYYRRGMEALLAGPMPVAALWPLIHTWTLAAMALPVRQTAAWQAAAEQLGLLGDLEPRLEALDRYMDQIEEHLEDLEKSHI